MDIDSPSAANTLHFGTNTPFIFHSAPRSPGYEPYDPSKWAAKDFRFGFSGGASGTGSNTAEDVEMRFGDSPARPREAQAPSGADEVIKSRSVEDAADNSDEGKKQAKPFEVGQSGEADSEARKIASGAMTRVRRKRQKEWRRRRGSESEPDDVSLPLIE
jgi:hypothetical protein